MFIAARDEPPLEFLRRRVIRVVPLYRFATGATIILFSHRQLWPADSITLSHIAKPLLFISYYSPQVPAEIWPALVPGWTLNYEMFVYCIFVIGIARHHLIIIVSTLLIALASASLFMSSRDAPWVTYTDPLPLEFLAGVYIGRYRQHLRYRNLIALVPIGLTALILSDLVNGPRVLLCGGPAAVIVIGALTIERTGRLPALPWLSKLGDASFSIYLFQVIAISIAGRLVALLPVHGAIQFLAMIAGSIAGSITLGLVGYHSLERSINRHLIHFKPAKPTSV